MATVALGTWLVLLVAAALWMTIAQGRFLETLATIDRDFRSRSDLAESVSKDPLGGLLLLASDARDQVRAFSTRHKNELVERRRAEALKAIGFFAFALAFGWIPAAAVGDYTIAGNEVLAFLITAAVVLAAGVSIAVNVRRMRDRAAGGPVVVPFLLILWAILISAVVLSR